MKNKIKKIVTPIFLSVLCGLICGKLMFSIYEDKGSSILESNVIYLLEDNTYDDYDSIIISLEEIFDETRLVFSHKSAKMYHMPDGYANCPYSQTVDIYDDSMKVSTGRLYISEKSVNNIHPAALINNKPELALPAVTNGMVVDISDFKYKYDKTFCESYSRLKNMPGVCYGTRETYDAEKKSTETNAYYAAVDLTDALPESLIYSISYRSSVFVLPLSIFLAWFAFTAIEGINGKFPSQSISTLRTTLPQARKSFVISYVIATVLSSVSTLVPGNFQYLLENAVQNNYIVGTLRFCISWLGTVIMFTVIYFAFYMNKKSHLEAMSFYALAVGLSEALVDIFTSLTTFISSAVTYIMLINSPEYAADPSVSVEYLASYSQIYTIRDIISNTGFIAGTVLILAIGFVVLKLAFNVSEECKAQNAELRDSTL